MDVSYRHVAGVFSLHPLSSQIYGDFFSHSDSEEIVAALFQNKGAYGGIRILVRLSMNKIKFQHGNTQPCHDSITSHHESSRLVMTEQYRIMLIPC